jgi:hypothetical protein
MITHLYQQSDNENPSNVTSDTSTNNNEPVNSPKDTQQIEKSNAPLA